MKGRIINISYSDFGGAGLASRRTHEFMLKAGYPSYLFLNESKVKNLENSIVLEKRAESFNQKVKTFINKIPTKRWMNIIRRIIKVDLINPINFYCFFSDKEKTTLHIDPILDFLEDGDIIILYWIGNFINSTNIVQMQNKKKVKIFWYALDMAAITGGCHFSWNCNGYQHLCIDCPALPYDQKLFAYSQLNLKKSNLNKCDIGLITSSSYGMDKCLSASLKFNSYHKLPYAINADIFDIPKTGKTGSSGKFRIFFNAYDKNDYRKGWSQFNDVLFQLDKLIAVSNIDCVIELVSVNLNEHKELEKPNIGLHDASGLRTTEEGLAELYHVSDLLVCTSIEDLCPLMINESLLCGVPVVAFDIAANREYVKDHNNGKIIPPFDVNQMAQAIYDIASGKIQLDTKENIRNSVLQLHGIESWKNNFAKILMDVA